MLLSQSTAQQSSSYADMAELADALASGASRGNPVKVQVLLSAFLFFFLLHLHTPAVTWHFM